MRPNCLPLLLLCSTVCLLQPARAQQAMLLAGTLPEGRPEGLPETPSALLRGAASDRAQTAQTPGEPLGTLKGVVTDAAGASVPGARITVTTVGAATAQTATSDGQGRYTVSHVPGGGFTITVEAEGLATAHVPGRLLPGQVYELPAIALRVASVSTSVDVSMTREELAQRDIKDAEQQRLLGVIPNYFVAYGREFTPLTAKQKFSLSAHVVLDPTSFAFPLIAAGIEQSRNTFPGYGDDAAAFGKRYAAAYGDGLFETMFRHAVYPAIFHQDPRYFYKGKGSILSRAGYAASTAFRCKGDNGNWQPNYSSAAGALTAGALSNLYYPASSRNGAALTFENAGIATAGVAVGRVLQEFLYGHITTKSKRAKTAQP